MQAASAPILPAAAPLGEEGITRLLVEAQRTGGNTKVDPGTLAGLDRAAAYRIVLGQQKALGEEVALYKTAIHPDGVGIAAPIWASRVGSSPGFVFGPGLDVKGLEFEVGVKLARDIPAGRESGVDESAVAGAIEHYFMGVEIVGTRLGPIPSGEKPGPVQGLADNLSALGYVLGEKYARGPDVSGLDISLELDRRVIDKRPAEPGFGTILSSLVAYAQSQHPAMPLKAGTVITTGSLNGCIPLPPGAKGRVVARLGHETPIEFTLG